MASSKGKGTREREWARDSFHHRLDFHRKVRPQYNVLHVFLQTLIDELYAIFPCACYFRMFIEVVDDVFGVLNPHAILASRAATGVGIGRFGKSFLFCHRLFLVQLCAGWGWSNASSGGRFSRSLWTR